MYCYGWGEQQKMACGVNPKDQEDRTGVGESCIMHTRWLGQTRGDDYLFFRLRPNLVVPPVCMLGR